MIENNISRTIFENRNTLISRVTSVVWCGLSKSLVFKKKKTACRAVRSCPPPSEQAYLLPPDTEDELIRHYAFGETDLSLIHQRRGDANRLGGAVQLCLLRFPAQGLLPDASMPMSLL